MENYYIISQNVMANKSLRFANYAIDSLITLGLTAAVMIVVMMLSDLLMYDTSSFLSYIEHMNRLEEYIFGLFITIPYYILMEGLTARTIGKYLTGTIVVDNEGIKPSTETLLKRSFCRAIPFNAVSFLGKKSRGWHDSISETYVVNKKLLEIEKQNYKELDQIGKKDFIQLDGYSI